jgi:hypothetical protein
MADDNVLKSFLVALGFTVDDEKHKQFQRALKLSTEEVEKLGLAITSVSLALAAGFERIADQFTSLFYISQRTGTTIQNLKDLQYAAGQVGVSSDAMTAALLHAQQLFQQPGGVAMVKAFTGFKGQITGAKQELDVLLDYLNKLYTSGGMGPFLARMKAQALGFNFDQLLPAIINYPREKAAEADYDRRLKAAGVDVEKLGKESVEFTNQLKTLFSEVDIAFMKAEQDWLGPFNKDLKAITDETAALVNQFAGLGQTARKEIEAIAAVGGAVAGWKLLSGTVSGVGRALGLVSTEAKVASGSLAGVLGAAGSIVAAVSAIEWLDQHFAPHGSEKRKKFYKDHPGFRLPDPAELFKKLFHHESYQVPTGSGPDGLLHHAAYTFGLDDRGVSGAFADWLHGNTSFVPYVRVLDDSAAGGSASGVTKASYETGGVGAGSSAPLGPGGTPGGLSKGGTALANKLYLHARSPVSEGGLGLDRAHTLAMLGNAFAESYLNPGAVGDNGRSFGLFQEHDDRMTAMFRDLGSRARDPLAQLDFAFKEQMARDPGFFARQGSVHDLTNDFERSFERPARPTDRGAFSDSIARALGAISDTRLGGDVHHHHGDVNISAPVNMTVHGNADAGTVRALRTAHNRTLGDAVRNIAPIYT